MVTCLLVILAVTFFVFVSFIVRHGQFDPVFNSHLEFPGGVLCDSRWFTYTGGVNGIKHFFAGSRCYNVNLSMSIEQLILRPICSLASWPGTGFRLHHTRISPTEQTPPKKFVPASNPAM